MNKAVQEIYRWYRDNPSSRREAPELTALYLELLLGAREKESIIGTREPEEILRVHIIPSLLLARRIAERTGADIGSGNGLPGILIAIYSPGSELTMLEPKKGRAAFLSKVIAETGIENAQVLRKRGEDAGRDPLFRERFGFACARAVAPPEVSLELALPLLTEGGRYYAQPGEEGAPLLTDKHCPLIREMGGEVEEKSGGVVIIRKVSATPSRFPRSWRSITAASRLKKRRN